MTTIGDRLYESEVRWTTHWVPHIRGADLGSVTFGPGWACARDHLPTIADQLVKADGQRARWHCRGPDDAHVYSDIGYSVLGLRSLAEAMVGRQPEPVMEAVTGCAAGLNAWLAEHGTDDLPDWCRGAEWINPFSVEDLFCIYNDGAVMASSRNFARFIGSATPPEDWPDPDPSQLGPDDLPSGPGLGSNAWALSGERTACGRGTVMANPHFPWYGEARFWEAHLTVPGEFDVCGASLVGTPGIQIGFTEGVAWSHTFSRGHRFCLYRLQLEEATTYRYEDELRDMLAADHDVDILTEDGPVVTETFRRYSSHHGPIVDLPVLGWSDDTAYALRDANLGNDRFLHQSDWERSLDQDLVAALMFEQRIALLDGGRSSHEWLDVDGAPAPGVEPVDRLPELLGADYVFNANDPYWAPHAIDRIERCSAMAGLYQRPLSPRTRTNAWVLDGAGRFTGRDGRVTSDELIETALGNHSLLAQYLCDDVVARGRAAGIVEVDGATVGLIIASDALDQWDRRYELDSVGAVLWREFLAGFSDADLRDTGPLFADGFDATDVIARPSTSAPAGDVDQVAVALARAVLALDEAGLTPDCRLGDVQFVERGGRRVALHGGGEVEGVTNVVMSFGGLTRDDLEPPEHTYVAAAGRDLRTGLHRGGYPVQYGVSFLMVAEFTDDGPMARGLLVYGQSGDRRSVHHVDQLEPFARKQLRPMLFRDAEIEAETIERRVLRGST